MVNICKNKPAFLVSTKIVKKEEGENTVKHANVMLSLVEISKFSKSMRNTSLKVIFSMREQLFVTSVYL